MLLGLCCMVAFSLCIIFWWTVVMLCMRNWFLFGIGLLVFVGIVLLTSIVAFVYWAIERLVCRARIRAEIKTAEAEQNTEEKVRLEARLNEETWGGVCVISLMVLLHIVVLGVGTPVCLIADCCDRLSEKIKIIFPKSAA